jgi:ankyrin repeat protein
LASDYGHTQIVELLISNGANINASAGINKYTPLHLAIANCSVKIVDRLIKNKADVNACTSREFTPLHFASWPKIKDRLDILKLLISAGANINSQDDCGDSPLHDSAIQGYIRQVEYLLQKGANPYITNDEGKTPYHSAARNGHPDIAKLILKYGGESVKRWGKPKKKQKEKPTEPRLPDFEE